jgi:hypothetical protein
MPLGVHQPIVPCHATFALLPTPTAVMRLHRRSRTRSGTVSHAQRRICMHRGLAADRRSVAPDPAVGGSAGRVLELAMRLIGARSEAAGVSACVRGTAQRRRDDALAQVPFWFRCDAAHRRGQCPVHGTSTPGPPVQKFDGLVSMRLQSGRRCWRVGER